jgi:hemoglobin
VQIRRRRGANEPTPYERWGGEQFFVDLVDRFYAEVVTDPLLTHMYPEDVTDSREHLALFLMQYWGGPTTYNEQRGAPRLRMRHVPFTIGQAEAEAWLRHMTAAVRAGHMDPDDEQQLLDYLAMAAESLINART